MTDGNVEDVEVALEAVRRNEKVRFHLRRFLGEETRYDEIDGHIFDLDEDPNGEGLSGWCKVSGCEMSSPEYAEYAGCPCNIESYELYTPDPWEEEY